MEIVDLACIFCVREHLSLVAGTKTSFFCASAILMQSASINLTESCACKPTCVLCVKSEFANL